MGRALLRGEFETAVRAVLTGRQGERPDIAAARRLFLEGGDAKVRRGTRVEGGRDVCVCCVCVLGEHKGKGSTLCMLCVCMCVGMCMCVTACV